MGRNFTKSITFFLEQSSHKYLEMGMNGGGVNQEGDKSDGGGLGGGPGGRGASTLGTAAKTKGKALKGVVSSGGGQKLAPVLHKGREEIKGKG